MRVRCKDNNNDGKFCYELWDGNLLVERVGNFESATDADRAAEYAHRRLVTCMLNGEKYEGIFTDISPIEDILKELDA